MVTSLSSREVRRLVLFSSILLIEKRVIRSVLDKVRFWGYDKHRGA